jgi:hypothetical protein
MRVTCEDCRRDVDLDREAAFRRVVQRKVFCQTCGGPLCFPADADLEQPLRPGRIEGTVVFAQRPGASVQAAIASLKHQEMQSGGDSLSFGRAGRVKQTLEKSAFVSAGLSAVSFLVGQLMEVGPFAILASGVFFSFAVYAFKKSR